MEAYKERMAAEYRELEERIKKLDAIIDRYYDGTLDFTLNCPIEILRAQRTAMGKYMDVLEIRAEIEGVEL